MSKIVLFYNGRIMKYNANLWNGSYLDTKQLADMSYAALDELGLIFDHILTSLKPLDQWNFKVRT